MKPSNTLRQTLMEGEIVKFPKGTLMPPSKGSAGLPTQIPGGIATVSNVAGASGGLRPSGLMQRDIK